MAETLAPVSRHHPTRQAQFRSFPRRRRFLPQPRRISVGNGGVVVIQRHKDAVGLYPIIMARSRVYRPKTSCPECGSNRMRKDGFTNDRLAYRCGDCQRGYASPGGACHRPGKPLKAPGIAMYLECSNLSAVGRILGYSPPRRAGS